MLEEGLQSRERRRRERKAHFGEFVQLDGSPREASGGSAGERNPQSDDHPE